MSDDATEDVIVGLIEAHLTGDARHEAIAWLQKRVATYRAIEELGLLDGGMTGSHLRH